MTYSLTVKSQVTLPKAVRMHLGIGPGDGIDYQPMPDGSVRVVAVPKKKTEDNPFTKWRGTGISGMTTDEIMRETRGDDWNR